MTDINESKGIESEFFIGTNANDVVAIGHTTMATEEPSVPCTHKDYRMLIDASGAGSVSALTLNDAATASAAAATAIDSTAVAATTTNVTDTMIDKSAKNHSNGANNLVEIKGIANNANNNNPIMNNTANNNNNNNNNNSINVAKNGAKGKRRRRKSKQMNNAKPYKKSNWKFQVPRSRDGRRVPMLVPYNTNKFLMEEHMPEFEAAGGRFRDSSFSIDSDENFDEEEFLSKEFSSVYETARAERLDEMNKQQLIQEYLQMESNYDKLCNSLKVRNRPVSKDVSMEIENQNTIKKLENHIKELTAENLDLRRQMADIRSREHQSPPNGRHRHHSSSYSSKRHAHHVTGNGNIAVGASSEDSESDSTSSSSSSSSNSSKSSSNCRSKLKRSRSRSSGSKSSKSSLSNANHMSGISDAEEAMHLLNGCDSNGATEAPVF